MIDTVILRIHKTRKYRNLIKSLDMLNIKGYTTEEAKVQSKDIHKLRNQGVTKPSELISILKMNRSGEFLVKSKVAKHQNASNHYQFAYFINYTADFIEFNFSIPKYVYGSNVLMFVDHIGDKGYGYDLNTQIEYNIEHSCDKFMSFMRHLFHREFGLTDYDTRDIEVFRIDVCFNQLFKNKSEALKYLEYQKRQRKKHSRDDDGQIKDYTTSLMYVTKRYSAKIYHKGTEYEKNDLREHLKINAEKGRQYFKTEEYKAFADRMLRYELTIRNGMLNYLHKNHLFRRKCLHWKLYFGKYQEVEAALQKIDRISKKIGELPEEEKAAYRKAHPYVKIEKETRKVYEYISKVITQRTYFVMGVEDEVKEYNQKMVNYECNKAQFSQRLLKECLYKLVEFMKEYQIKELPPEDIIARKIDQYNFEHKKQLCKSEMVQFYKDVLRTGSFRATAKFNYLSRATLYRYKQRFKKIGITDANLIPLTEDGIPEADLDLRAYHSEHMFNARFLNKNSLFDIL